MYSIPELGPICTVYREPRIFFTIEYVTPDGAFARAAETWRKIVPAEAAFNPAMDEVLGWQVPSENAFYQVWSLVAAACRVRKAKAFYGALFTHASKEASPRGGLEFRPAPGDDGTLSRAEISGLTVLPWHDDGALVLTGCNTGLVGKRGWCPASVFAATQKVRTLGQTGYAYFSKSWSRYEEAKPLEKRICLWAFARRRNSMLGDGSRMPGRVYT